MLRLLLIDDSRESRQDGQSSRNSSAPLARSPSSSPPSGRRFDHRRSPSVYSRSHPTPLSLSPPPPNRRITRARTALESILIRGTEHPKGEPLAKNAVEIDENSHLQISRSDQISKLNLERVYCLQTSGEASVLLYIFAAGRLSVHRPKRTGLYWTAEDIGPVPRGPRPAISHSSRRKLDLGHKFITRPLTW